MVEIDTSKVREYKTTAEKFSRYKYALDDVKKVYKELEDIRDFVKSKHSTQIPKEKFSQAEALEKRLKVLQSEIRYLAVSILDDIINCELMMGGPDEGLKEATLTVGELIQEFLKHPLAAPVISKEVNSDASSLAIFDISFFKGVVIIATTDDLMPEVEEALEEEVEEEQPLVEEDKK